MPDSTLDQRVQVSDPFGAAADPAFAAFAQATDPAAVGRALRDAVPRFANRDGQIEVTAIRVIRHKAGRRCMIEYDLGVAPGSPPVTLIAKMRAKSLDLATFSVTHKLRRAGLDEESSDGIAVPEPIALIPRLQMWLQRKAPGTAATELLAGPDGVAVARRCVDVIHKLHRAGISSERRHSIADELLILRRRLDDLARARPHWARRLQRLLDACHRLTTDMPTPSVCGIHRDFYADHVLVSDNLAYLIDLDLFCLGDPSLDVGNFIAHITEQSLRTLGDPDALVDRERAIEQRFAELRGDDVRHAVRTYATLTLVRHIHISTTIADRGGWTEALLQLCEQRIR